MSTPAYCSCTASRFTFRPACVAVEAGLTVVWAFTRYSPQHTYTIAKGSHTYRPEETGDGWRDSHKHTGAHARRTRSPSPHSLVAAHTGSTPRLTWRARTIGVARAHPGRPRSSQHTSTPLQVPFHTRHVAWATQCGHTGLSRGSPILLSLTPARLAQTLTLARARPLSPAPHRCPRPGGPPSRHITGSLTADTATQAELVKRMTRIW